MKFLKKIFKLIFTRVFFVSLGILLQIIWWMVVFFYMTSVSSFVSGFVKALSIVVVLWLVNKKINPSYKLAWTLLMLSVPVLGVLIYFLFGRSSIAKKMQERYETVMEREKSLLYESKDIRARLDREDRYISKQSVYIRDYSGFPLHKNTNCEYYSSGEEMFPSMLRALKNAKHFIFLEYFIIGDGVMWQAIVNILEQKAEEGVDVRLIYDDFGCITTLPYHFYKELQSKGIKCASFNPYRPFLNVILNNRDHRKICVVDGYIGFTGGINLADEYINRVVRFGYWKDTAIRLEGDGVWNLTAMFLQMWTVITRTETNFQDYLPNKYHQGDFQGEGYVQPYCDTPLDEEIVGECVYLNVINHASDYVYICTPYLIIDNEIMTALCLAAKNGVDVRIITPGIPDKKTVFLLTQSYYEQLIEAGVKIYEYQPGFVHAKSFVSDDKLAVIGTINLDYRSLYLHFENGVWIYNNPVVLDMKKDFTNILGDCKAVSLEFCKNRNIFIRGFQSILRLLAPML